MNPLNTLDHLAALGLAALLTLALLSGLHGMASHHNGAWAWAQAAAQAQPQAQVTPKS